MIQSDPSLYDESNKQRKLLMHLLSVSGILTVMENKMEYMKVLKWRSKSRTAQNSRIQGITGSLDQDRPVGSTGRMDRYMVSVEK